MIILDLNFDQLMWLIHNGRMINSQEENGILKEDVSSKPVFLAE